MKRKVILAENAGFCFGVKRAVDESLNAKNKYNKKIYTLGPLIHNKDVVKDLEEKNIEAIDFDNIDKLNKEDVIVIRSHGVKENVIATLNSKGLVVDNATCPYVTNIHKKVNEYYNKGYQIVIMGDKNHPEVIGINGWCNDSAIITTADDIESEFPKKVCLVSQTTEKKENWNKVVARVAMFAKELVAFNTICAATDVRQSSAEEISKKADMVIVIGGKSSSNTTKLFEICKKNCKNTYHIENANDLTEDIINFECETIGVTAGASTPDYIIEEVIKILENN
ncbi:4-hydroxy-3-methylbut-2-enyl diphosphate reductase [Clostridium mediterraneense]|uniref:4-hydroxy-3-methylbut-2-enyl diphosphate reductase n=1 Tax=Clostridium mediterraneense TaxID=1805472 RepID=UPI000831A2E3|nr:4-hydroxy-3-methylbut-2-enyl diphosphate reductase [Clostridium mediterraneense]